ncbi:MAG: carbon-nitrogen family hydrolase [Desulfobacula sp.]|nr:carbon-nitrogen family hydrolase [Desulfobacula sp.]
MKKKIKFKAGVVQFDVKAGQIEANLNSILGYLEKLASNSVNLAVLPEMFSCSFDNENLRQHAKLTNKVLERLSLFARENQMAIAGSLPEEKDDQIFNTMVFIERDGQIKARYRKLHLFKLTGEHLYYSAGNEIAVIDSSFGRIGLMICYDLRFPELARALSLHGVKMIIVSAQWPESRREHWETLIKARAIENQLFMVCSNRTGMENNLKFPGMSMVVDPMGIVLIQGKDNDTSIFADVDPSVIKDARTLIPCMADRRDDIYGK